MRVNWTTLAILIVPIILVIGAYFIGQSVWLALTAVGTIGVVLVALFYPEYQTWRNRPLLVFRLFESEHPHLRRVPIREDSTGKTLNIVYTLHLELKNTWRTVARKALPLLSGMARFINGRWETQDDWIPVSLLWALDELVRHTTGRPTEERDLVPKRPYVFSLGFLSVDRPDSFQFDDILIPRNQPNEYQPGEFCFQISAYAEGADPLERYVHIQWDGGCTEDFEEVKKRIKVFLKEDPPW